MFNLAERLPACIHSITIEDVGDLDVHCLLAGQSSDPLLLLLHGFPELSFSWRKIMPALAQLGYFVVAPDQRGYGRTRAASLRGRDTGWTYRLTLISVLQAYAAWQAMPEIWWQHLATAKYMRLSDTISVHQWLASVRYSGQTYSSLWY